MEEIKPKVETLNTGFLPIRIRTDFLGGTLPFEKRIPNGQWDKFLPTKELQRIDRFDAMGCVSFSANNVIEMQFNWMIDSGILKGSDPAYIFLKQNGYFDNNGMVNLSDRFLAKISNTTPNGNGMTIVADALRHYGAVPENVWSFPKNSNWTEFYKSIPKNVINLGEEFLKYFEIKYEWAVGWGSDKLWQQSIKNHLMHAPIQVGTAICWGWKDGSIIKACGQPIIHATSVYGYKDGKYWKDFDHYLNKFGDVKKKLAWDYNIPFALKIVLIKKNNTNMSDLKTSHNLLQHLRKFQVMIVPDSNGELYLADCSLGKNSWKLHLNEFGLAQQFKYVAHGVSKTKASKIRTVLSLKEVEHLYK